MTPNYPGDWLSKTFNEDVVVCASTILGGPVVVNWSPLEEVSSEVMTPADDMKNAGTHEDSILDPKGADVHKAPRNRGNSFRAGPGCRDFA